MIIFMQKIWEIAEFFPELLMIKESFNLTESEAQLVTVKLITFIIFPRYNR